MPRARSSSSKNNSTANLGFEAKLWLAADKLRRQLVAKAIVPEGEIIDVFSAAGLKQPDISILSDQFLAEVRGLKYKNVAAELLAKLLGDEIRVRSKRNLVQSREFSEMLKKTLNAYHNRAIATQEVIEELIKLAKEMSAATQRGVDLGLNDEEVAFYDALSANDSAVEAMGQDELKVIAAELVTQVRKKKRHDRLDCPRGCESQDQGDGQAHPAEARLPTRLARRGGDYRSCPGGDGESESRLGVSPRIAAFCPWRQLEVPGQVRSPNRSGSTEPAWAAGDG